MKLKFIHVFVLVIMGVSLTGCGLLNRSVVNYETNKPNKVITPDNKAKDEVSEITYTEKIVLKETRTVTPKVDDKVIEKFIENEKGYLWNKFPLNVYILPHKHYRIAKKAFNIWQSYSPKRIFSITSDESNADIIFEFTPTNAKFVDKVSSPGNSCPQGYTYYHYSYQIIDGVNQPPYMDKANIYVSVGKCGTTAPIPEEELLWMSVHEIGHALGLTHSANKKDVMYPVYYPNQDTEHPNDFVKFQNLYHLR